MSHVPGVIPVAIAEADQATATQPTVSVWVNASAGSGKTKVLTDRVLRLMLAGTDPAKIQCLTFTKAAAAEMALRLQNTLAEWVRLDDARLDAALRDRGIPPTDDIRAAARRLFARVLDLPGGMRILQYRNKSANAALRLEQATALSALCREFDATLIINDDLELAIAVDAGGLHLGGEDGSLAGARARLGPRKRLGASCYRSLDNAERAIAEGADHIAFGSFFVSTVKPGAVRSSPSLLTEAKQKFKVPVVAIGGITAGTICEVARAGAAAAAVIDTIGSGQWR